MTARQSYPVLAKAEARNPDTGAGRELTQALDEIDELRALCDGLVEVEE